MESKSIFFLPNIVRGDPYDFNKLQNLTIPFFKTNTYKPNVGTKHSKKCVLFFVVNTENFSLSAHEIHQKNTIKFGGFHELIVKPFIVV